MSAEPTTAAAASPTVDTAALDARFALLQSVGEECISETELRNLLEKKPNIRCYDGFEPSGRMHIAQGIFKAINVNKCTSVGCEFVFWVADWFALMNDKMGGELERIRIVGKYLLEVWGAAGMDMTNVKFLWSSDEINRHAEEYWRIVLDIARRNTIARIKKCCTIMGKQEGTLSAAQILYPLMQCADVFFLKADICQLGKDQRKVNMLAREYCDLTKRKLKPVILSHHMLAGLKQGQAKMSKSDPDSAIFMEDSREDVERKIMAAYCPRAVQETVATEDGLPASDDNKNPVLDYMECVVFSRPGHSITIDGVAYKTYKELEAAFLAETISEETLKKSLIAEVNDLLDPVRAHFQNNKEAGELLEQVKSFRKGGVAEPAAPVAVEEPKERTPTAVAWLPAKTRLSLGVLLSIVDGLNAFVKKSEGHEAYLVLPDWSATARDEVTGVDKDVEAALLYHAELAKAFGLDSRVKVVRQGADVMLKAPDAYWVAAINAGRKSQLRDVEEALGGQIQNAGEVCGCLMRAADAARLNATHLLSTSADAGQNALAARLVSASITTETLAEGIAATLLDPKVPPTVIGADDVLNADDTDMDSRRKLKRAYCAEKEDANPVVQLGQWLIATRQAKVEVKRPESNGGDVVYTDSAALASDSLSGALHPADLKPAVTNALLELTTKARAAITSAEMKKYSTTLRNAEKKLAKK
jgi:tyrosyl-tRNA synthetase